ncbi:beta-ketoacyl-ACP synthase [Hyphomicrobium sp. CS1BSMeth3]|uniref:beta-ketoacyl-ACP synthase n=1 Tax=Hyphomicrobium sp. CS1BSMeth3 TaxID=1892844 RepID=UPI000931297B|nr:beta-ketoacyl-ACP synthase [Hyphomicrobium sp. CS1BSMeth3]
MRGNDHENEVWITGVGLVSSLGEGVEAHARILSGEQPCAACVDETTFAPYPVHPLVPLTLSKQIPKNSDQRQMEGWQRLGVYAAGLALEDAQIKGCADLLDRMDLIVAAGSGERDTAVDCKVLEMSGASDSAPLRASEILPSALRPTLFLAQLSNLLAGNISIVHHVTGSSRTFMGEEMAGLSAIDNAFQRIAAGQSEMCLVGGAVNAEREDLLLAYELGHNLWRHSFERIEQRAQRGGGFVPGSVGAFLVLEQRRHAERRSARAYARVTAVGTDRMRRTNVEANPFACVSNLIDETVAGSTGAVFSGASGVAPVTAAEFAFLDELKRRAQIEYVWPYGNILGHAVEAHFPAGIALAALAQHSGRVSRTLLGECPGRFSSVDRIIVTGVGHERGEGVAVIDGIPTRGANGI